MGKHHFLAIDLGAESGRAVAGILDNNRLYIEEIHRFPVKVLELDGHFYWNIYRFYEEILNSLNICVNKERINPESLAVDSWGVDFGFFGEDGMLNRLPYAYRDPSGMKGMDEFISEKVSSWELYKLTGVAIQGFNSLFQLYSMIKREDLSLKGAVNLMFIPDILNYFLTGRKVTEFSFATTSQLYNPGKGDWEEEIFTRLGLPVGLMNSLIKPGEKIAMLKEDISRQVNIMSIPVVSVCTHDTGSALVSIPAEGDDWAFISSGTWSLMGIENRFPIINKTSFKYNFTNEGGAEGTYRLLKNIMGLWILQECRRSWSGTGSEVSYEDLLESVQHASPFKTCIDPDYEGFFNPPDMPSAIDSYCTNTNQETPETVGEYVRTILEGLAFKYRHVLDQLKEINVKKVNRIFIIGGGSKNRVLCQFTANVTGLKVISGLSEGTATGNILIQAKALGHIDSLSSIRKTVRNSFHFETYKPENTREWNQYYLKWKKIVKID